MKVLKIFLCSVLIFALFSVNCFALTGATYADVAQSNSTVQNLISCANNYSSFRDADFVVFQNGQYSYYIFWGDLEYNGSSVSASEAEFVSYIRQGSGYDYAYTFDYGNSEALSLTVSDLVVSNIEGLGSSSALYEQYRSYDENMYFSIFILACLIVSMFLAFRRTFK